LSGGSPVGASGVFLSPHNDDETLFGAYTLLGHRPYVVVCLRSFVEELVWGNGATWQVREAETAGAMDVLGCSWEQWEFSDLEPDWLALEAELRRLDPDRLWAPAVERDGHPHHNRIGALAAALFPNRVVHYLTYTRGGKSTRGTAVPVEPGWPELKRCALACYQSQHDEPRTQAHFHRPLDEYYAKPSAVARWSSRVRSRRLPAFLGKALPRQSS
jgi:LmbE family N-acetylglucosaminyl deacetylase